MQAFNNLLLQIGTSPPVEAAAEAGSSEGLGGLLTQLGINLPLLIAQLVNFALLFTLIYLFGYKRILRMLDERSKRVKEGLDKAEDIKRQAAQAEQTFKVQMDTARKESQTIIGQASQMGDRLKEEARQEAKKEAELLITRAHGEINRERDETLDKLRREFADIAILAAEKVIQERLDKETHRKVIDRVLQESSSFKAK